MLINIMLGAIFLLVAGSLVVLSGARKKHVGSASVGGCIVGISIVMLAIQFFYLSQLGETNPGIVYHGSTLTEFLLGAGIVAGLGLVLMSVIAGAKHKFLWQLKRVH